MSEQPRDQGGRFASTTSDGNNGEYTDNSASQGSTVPPDADRTTALLEKLTAQNQELMEQNRALSKQLENSDAERRAEKLSIALNQRKAELKELSPALAEKYKDEASLERLDFLIEASKDAQKGFAEYSPGNRESIPKPLMKFNPYTNKIEKSD